MSCKAGNVEFIAETERINGFKKGFYKCVEVSPGAGTEISRCGKPRTTNWKITGYRRERIM